MRLLRSRARDSRLRLDVEEARRLTDAERRAGDSPDGCAPLDERTVADLDLPLVFRVIDRTVSATGAQALWRWLAAPAVRTDVLHARERKLARLTDPALRARIADVIRRTAAGADAALLPMLLWEPIALPNAAAPIGVACGLAACVLGGLMWPILWLGALAFAAAAFVLDDWSKLGVARHSRALEVLSTTLDAASRLGVPGRLPDELVADLAPADLAPRGALAGRLALLRARDPLDLLDLVRAALLVRLFVTRSCLRIVAAEQLRLRRVVLWVGELDALAAIARVRAERGDARVPLLAAGPRRLEARDIVHPAIDDAVGTDVVLAGTGLLVTGSNMSGKSTLMRALALNAILAQSIHTTFGAWRTSLVRVATSMKIADDVEHGQSTYAVQVAAVGRLLRAADDRGTADVPWLFALDEPFNGTNPAVRVPIVVAVLDYLARHDLVLAATHDLDVANRVGDAFARGHFAELESGFDRKLRPGIAPAVNAVELLERAGYPAEVLAAIRA